MLHHPLTPLRCLLEPLHWQIQKLVGCYPQPHHRPRGRLGFQLTMLRLRHHQMTWPLVLQQVQVLARA